MAEVDNDRNAVSLREFVEEKFAAIEKANMLFMERLDDRLESMNRFREDLRRQAAEFMTRKEFEASHQRVLDDIRSLRESRATLDGKASQLSVTITFVIAMTSVAVAIVALVVNL